MAWFLENEVRKKRAELEVFRFYDNRLRLRIFECFIRAGCTSQGSMVIFHIWSLNFDQCLLLSFLSLLIYVACEPISTSVSEYFLFNASTFRSYVILPL